jgi:translation initiation factor 2B subunit (eIF-2B alpha/beta/delta family)
MKRDKITLEKLLSLLHRKRYAGAKELLSLMSTDFESKKTQTISDNEVVYTHGSSNDIEERFNALKIELFLYLCKNYHSYQVRV